MLVGSLLRGALLPALICGAVLAFAWWRSRGGGSRGWPVLAIALGYVAGHVAIIGRPPFPAVEATQWQVWFILAAALVALPLARFDAPAAVGWARRVLFGVAVPALLLVPLLRHRWETAEGLVWIVGLGALFVILAAALESGARRLRGLRFPPHSSRRPPRPRASSLSAAAR